MSHVWMQFQGRKSACSRQGRWGLNFGNLKYFCLTFRGRHGSVSGRHTWFFPRRLNLTGRAALHLGHGHKSRSAARKIYQGSLSFPVLSCQVAASRWLHVGTWCIQWIFQSIVLLVQLRSRPPSASRCCSWRVTAERKAAWHNGGEMWRHGRQKWLLAESHPSLSSSSSAAAARRASNKPEAAAV